MIKVGSNEYHRSLFRTCSISTRFQWISICVILSVIVICKGCLNTSMTLRHILRSEPKARIFLWSISLWCYLDPVRADGICFFMYLKNGSKLCLLHSSCGSFKSHNR